jgi:hypothetical protein
MARSDGPLRVSVRSRLTTIRQLDLIYFSMSDSAICTKPLARQDAQQW